MFIWIPIVRYASAIGWGIYIVWKGSTRRNAVKEGQENETKNYDLNPLTPPNPFEEPQS